MSLLTFLLLAFQVSLLLTVFGFGLEATLDDVLHVFRRPGLLVCSLVSMFLVMPIAAVALVTTFHAPGSVEMVLVVLAISPIPPLLPRRIRKADKAAKISSYGIGLLTTASLLSIIYMPAAIWVLGRYFHRPVTIPAAKIVGLIVETVVLPIVAGMAVKHILPAVASRIIKPAGIFAGVLLTAAALVLLGIALPALWKLIGDGTIVMMTMFVVIGLTTGHLLAGSGIEHQGVLALATVSRHPAIALAVAGANASGQRFGSVILLYLLVNLIVCVPYIKWQQARAARELKSAD